MTQIRDVSGGRRTLNMLDMRKGDGLKPFSGKIWDMLKSLECSEDDFERVTCVAPYWKYMGP